MLQGIPGVGSRKLDRCDVEYLIQSFRPFHRARDELDGMLKGIRGDAEDLGPKGPPWATLGSLSSFGRNWLAPWASWAHALTKFFLCSFLFGASCGNICIKS